MVFSAMGGKSGKLGSQDPWVTGGNKVICIFLPPSTYHTHHPTKELGLNTSYDGMGSQLDHSSGQGVVGWS